MCKLNKYGCRPSGDVCLEHSSPLITFGICGDNPDIKEYVDNQCQAIENELAEAKARIKFLKASILSTYNGCIKIVRDYNDKDFKF